MRVLSRRPNLPKAVACGYYEGAGFVVLTEPSPLSFALLLWVRCTTRRRGVGEVCSQAPRGCAHSAVPLGSLTVTHTQSGPHQQEAERAATWGRWPLLDGVGEVCKGRRGHVTRAAGHSARPVTSPHQQERSRQARGDGVGRRPTTPLDDVGERSPAPATAAAALWMGGGHRPQTGF